MTTLVIADIHGCYTPLDKILRTYSHQGHDLIFLGDYIDRSPEPDGDIRVLNRVRSLTEEPIANGYASCVAIRGNHEQLFIDAVKHNDYELWEYNGGNAAAIPELKGHLQWMDSLPHYEQKADYLFVHAGIRPGIALKDQDPHDLIWIRKEFLTCKDHGLSMTVVAGHSITPSREIEIHPGRIAMDTGSFATGLIGHAVFDC